MGGLQEFAFKETQNYHVRFPFKNPISVTEPLRVDCVLDAPKTLSFFLFHHYFLCRSQLSKNSLFQSQWIKLLFIRQDFIMSFYRYRDSRKLHNIWLKTKWRFLDQSLTWLLVLQFEIVIRVLYSKKMVKQVWCLFLRLRWMLCKSHWLWRATAVWRPHKGKEKAGYSLSVWPAVIVYICWLDSFFVCVSWIFSQKRTI